MKLNNNQKSGNEWSELKVSQGESLTQLFSSHCPAPSLTE